MSMPSRATTDTSVTISLAELAKIEEARVREEESERIRAREERARAERQAEAARRAAEAAEAEAAAGMRARRAREEAIEQARIEARERASAEVLRIEAEARARLDADNAVRAHELGELRVRRETGRRRREYALSAVLAAVVSLGGAMLYDRADHATKLERTVAELREGQRSLAGERDDAKRTELQALDRRHAALRARTPARGADDAQRTVEAARAGIDERAPDHGRLRAFADALDALQSRIESIEKLALLDRRHADLAAWAASVRRSHAASDARGAAQRARAPGAGATALAAYERALDGLRDELARRAPGGGRPIAVVDPGPGPQPGRCQQGDPSCGLDGRPLF